MHRILVFGEKLHASSWYAPHLSRTFPNSQITIVHCNYLGILQPKLPRGRKLNEYPMTVGLDWTPKRSLTHPAGCWVCTVDGDRVIRVPGPHDFSSLLLQSDEVIYAADPDHSSCRNFVAFLDFYGSEEERSKKHRAAVISSWSQVDLVRSFSNFVIFEDYFERSAKYGICKSYFDLNYAANALAVFGNLLRSLGMPAQESYLSKYTLQLLYWFADQDRPHSESHVYHFLSHWKGTGKYHSTWNKMGSPASMGVIINNLKNMRLVDTWDRRLVISTQGRRLVEAMHPNCRDSDLLYRLDEWCNQGLSVSKPKIDKYIRTFFGRQLAFMKRSDQRHKDHR
jgi:hypothetical protein